MANSIVCLMTFVFSCIHIFWFWFCMLWLNQKEWNEIYCLWVEWVQGGTHGQILLRACTCIWHIWLRARQIGLFTWVEQYKSDSGQFCLSYNHIKYELKHFFQPIFDHNYLYSNVCTICLGREPNLSSSESDMYTVNARRKICPCVPPRTRWMLSSSSSSFSGRFNLYYLV